MCYSLSRHLLTRHPPRSFPEVQAHDLRLAMNIEEQKSKAVAFRGMHRGDKVLILPNAWDVASARIFENAGFGAVASTSAGVAFSLGYPDGEKISREEMLA